MYYVSAAKSLAIGLKGMEPLIYPTIQVKSTYLARRTSV